MFTHAIISSIIPAMGSDTLCQYGPDNRNNAWRGSRDLDKVDCPDCLVEIEKRMPSHHKVQPFIKAMDIL